MNCGRALGVECNPWHGANDVSITGAGTDAYWSSFAVTDAACGSTDSYYQPFLTWTHSAIQEKRFVDPLQAVSNAFCLQWEVLKADYNDLSRSSSPLHFSYIDPFTRSQRPHSKKSKGLHVQFVDQIDVLIGLDDCSEMHCLQIDSCFLRNWTDKPWSRRRVKNQTDFRSTSALNCQTFQDDLLAHCVSEGFQFKIDFPSPFQAPLSHLAVLSRGVISQNDDVSFMQASSFKRAPHSNHEAARVEAFAGGQTVPPMDQFHEGSDSSSSSRDGADDEPTSSTGGSDIRPPNSTENRQEVIMFHLRDPPLRALLDWTDYDSMITEIAYHFATTPLNVVDAYEINSDLPGVLPAAVPIIVHLLPDIPFGQLARLALFDLEFHAHSTEAAFTLGPATQRFVLATPEWCDRRAILVLAGVDVYCERENDRCFVWHDGVRWQDTDVNRRQIAHGDYFRIALPPTERFNCATTRIVELTQGGFSDDEILHDVVNQEAASGYSPSLLDDDEVRALASRNGEVDQIEADHFHAMQYGDAVSSSGDYRNNSLDPASSDSSIEEDWFWTFKGLSEILRILVIFMILMTSLYPCTLGTLTTAHVWCVTTPKSQSLEDSPQSGERTSSILGGTTSSLMNVSLLTLFRHRSLDRMLRNMSPISFCRSGK